MRIVVIADVNGQGHYHLGDEAMLEANLQMFRRLYPDIEFTVVSGDPGWTQQRYGVESVRSPLIPPGHTGASWTRRMREAARADRHWAEWLGDEIVAALRTSAGLLVSGGGNLSATWPEKVLERVALIEQACEMGLPAVMTGQTLGPALTPDQRHLLGESLPKLVWLGVRDADSAALARELGVPAERVCEQLDDAFFLEPAAVDDERAEPFRGDTRWIVITLDASFGAPERAASLSVLASQLDSLAEFLKASVVFVPHVGGVDTGDADSDATAGRALAARMRSKLLLLDLWQPCEVRWLIGRAAMVVSTRYHPIVFATAAGVPAFAISCDHYTRTKLRGALAPAGQTAWCVPLAEVERGSFLCLALELWHRRSAIRDRLNLLHSEAVTWELERWEGICKAFGQEQRVLPTIEMPPLAAAIPPSRARRPGTQILSEEQWSQYDRDGYLRLGKLLNDHDLSALRERMDAIMPVEDPPEATADHCRVQGLESDPMVLEFIRLNLFREICARHYGAHASVSILRIMLENKPAGLGTCLPWRQGAAGVGPLDRDPLFTLWVALDPVTRINGCVQVVPGTHRLGMLSDGDRNGSPPDTGQYYPESAIESLELDAGEGLLLHNWLLQRSDVNRTSYPQRTLTACYVDGRTLNTLSGTRFPIVFGEFEDIDSAFPFLRALTDENRRLRETAEEAARYATSLAEDNAKREEMRCETVRYARALERELERLRTASVPACT